VGRAVVEHLVGTAVLAQLPAHQSTLLTGRGFFPALIVTSFANGLHAAFDFTIGACLVAVGASWLRGGRYRYQSETQPTEHVAPLASEPLGASAGTRPRP
jgi:hypothetical protein